MFVYLKWATNTSDKHNIDPYGSLIEYNNSIREFLTILKKLDRAKLNEWIKDFRAANMIIKPVHELLERSLTFDPGWTCVSTGKNVPTYVVDAITGEDYSKLRQILYQVTIDPYSSPGEIRIKGELL